MQESVVGGSWASVGSDCPIRVSLQGECVTIVLGDKVDLAFTLESFHRMNLLALAAIEGAPEVVSAS
ncbi:hypothetical protein CLV68_5248 [Actinokineospora cianjurensis]|uniref:Uncharacterized protein n=1 Tax=Actinokineospora cianjurensis TaxID=585224 RepID=A0A421AYG7_9PSEU|nr:hypothetical protein CLV68_5248 [Actinokineospora cianjurensis]